MDRFAMLTAFVKVAELRGFAQAARKLDLSPSAVTRLVAALEEHLGIRLLQRTTRLVTPTDEGERYLLMARRILSELEEADASLQATQAAPSGRLSVSAPLAFGRLHVGPLLSRYLSRFPAVHGELILSDRMVNLIDDGIDVAIRIGIMADSSLKMRRIGETRRVVVAAPDYLSRRGIPAAPDEIARHRCIHFAGFRAGSEWEFQQLGTPIRVASHSSFITNSADTAIQHAIDGGGLTMVLAYQASDAIASGALQIVLADHELPPLPIQIVYPTSRLLSAKVRSFIDMTVAETDWSFADLGRAR